MNLFTKKYSQPLDDMRGESCPVCGSREWVYLMNRHGLRYFACSSCELVRTNPHPGADDISRIYKKSEFVAEPEKASSTFTQRTRAYWNRLQAKLRAERTEKILLISSDTKQLWDMGREMGFKNILASSELGPDDAARVNSPHDAAVIVLALERTLNPKTVLRQVYDLLKTGGNLLLVVPMLDSWPARFLKSSWTELRPENLYYFNSQNIQSILLECGFREIVLQHDKPLYSLQHIYRRACMYPRTFFTKSIIGLLGLVPVDIRRHIRVRGPSSVDIVTCRKSDVPDKKTLSIVMPAYNEGTTFRECFDRVLAKQIRGLDKEIVVVESNSADGTRELAKTLCGQAGVRLILQDRPRGKGNAVREGLKAATGDIVLIQDADLEYDVEDYDALLNPILNNKAAFVLGSRHTGNFKVREFNDQKISSFYFNAGHLFFRGLMNLFYRQSMKDPFTMYKVFRKDCLYGLHLECNRFDFDIEIVIKLIRKGYSPLEVPVNYRSRSFKEGKKVTAFRDPLTWIWAITKYRFCNINSSLRE
jgi:hypothetical protein